MSDAWELIDVAIPEFGAPDERPGLDRAIYLERIDRLRLLGEKWGLNALIVYADREHFANLAYLTGFDPRFEEALLVLVPGRDPLLITGPENQGYSEISPIDLERILYPPFGLLGQDRSRTSGLTGIFMDAGLKKGWRIGVAGWKYFGKQETATPETWLETPAYIVDTLRSIAGQDNVVNAGGLFMDASEGLRAINEIDQLAQFEHAACHASEAVKRVLSGLKPGMSEYDIAAQMQFGGFPVSCHPMCSSGPRTKLGLAGPSDRKVAIGEPMQVAIGLWGALTCRAGWIAFDETDLPRQVSNYVERLAGPYFDCAAQWYEMVGIGVTGGAIDAMVKDRLGDPFFGLALNPGHLIHLDEWMNTPIYPGSTEKLQSGQAIQLDIIPATGSEYATANIEDGIALLDEPGRRALRANYPGAWARIEARRGFLAETLGIRLKPEVLPFSNLAGCLSPFMLAPERVLARRIS
jgi:hypothetical protein